MAGIAWHIGCSGFHYREWKEEFYPAGLVQRKWFDYYTQHFNTLELNVTFYKFPTVKSLQCWYEEAPDHFSFSAKVPRAITHYKKFNGTEQMVKDFYGLLRVGLAEKLGCVLFQLPPQFAYTPERLETVLAQTDPEFRNVIEFRHASWWRADVQERLSAHGISFCGVSFPGLRYDEAVVNLPLCYYRFHGVPILFHSEYDPLFIEKIFNQISNDHVTRQAFIYFNNTASLAALHNARQFQELVVLHSVTNQ